MVPENINVFCGTIPIILLKYLVFTLFKSWPSINIAPLHGSINFNINEKIVLLPAPDGPTKAIFFPLSISKFISFITSLSASVSYTHLRAHET